MTDDLNLINAEAARRLAAASAEFAAAMRPVLAQLVAAWEQAAKILGPLLEEYERTKLADRPHCLCVCTRHRRLDVECEVYATQLVTVTGRLGVVPVTMCGPCTRWIVLSDERVVSVEAIQSAGAAAGVESVAEERIPRHTSDTRPENVPT